MAGVGGAAVHGEELSEAPGPVWADLASDASLAVPLETVVLRAPKEQSYTEIGQWEAPAGCSLYPLPQLCGGRGPSVAPDPVGRAQLLLWAPVTPVVPLSLVLGVAVCSSVYSPLAGDQG